MCHKQGCGLIIHPLCCGLQRFKRRFSCPRCTAPHWHTLPRMRYVACIMLTNPGDLELFGVWLGCALLFASDVCCVIDMCYMGTVLIMSISRVIRFLQSSNVVVFPPQHNRTTGVCCTWMLHCGLCNCHFAGNC